MALPGAVSLSHLRGNHLGIDQERALIQENNDNQEEDTVVPEKAFEEYASFFNEAMDTEKNQDESTSTTVYEAFEGKAEQPLATIMKFSSPLTTTSHDDIVASLYYIEWKMSGPDHGCTSTSRPEIKLECSNGGRLHIDRPCIMHGDDAAVCMHSEMLQFFDISTEALTVWCSGMDSRELGLTATLMSLPADCLSASGEIFQSLSLGHTCGSMDHHPNDLRLDVDEKFCVDSFQFQAPESNNKNPKCMAVAMASQDSTNVVLPSVRAVADTPDDSCIYSIAV